MKGTRISGFQWAMMAFIFAIVAEVLPMILKDFQGAIHLKRFVFDMSYLAPFIGAILCIIIFKHRGIQMQSMKLTINLKVVERMILALLLPIIIFVICMISFNVFADSFILLQAKDLSVSVFEILIGQLIMAFLVELGFRSYLQNILETKLNTFFASIIVGFFYAIWNINIANSLEYAQYNVLYSFAFSMLVGELIRATGGRTIYIATLFHAAMSFGLVFLFNEELGNVFAMKVIALSTAGVAAAYILLSLVLRSLIYFYTKKSLDEVEPNNYMDHIDEQSDFEALRDEESTSSINNQDKSHHEEEDDNLKTQPTHESTRHSSAVTSAEASIDESRENARPHHSESNTQASYQSPVESTRHESRSSSSERRERDLHRPKTDHRSSFDIRHSQDHRR